MRIHLPDGMKRGATPGEDPITKILKTCKTIAVVGLSSDAKRRSFGVSEYMKAAGYRNISSKPKARAEHGGDWYKGWGLVAVVIGIGYCFWQQRGERSALDRAR